MPSSRYSGYQYETSPKKLKPEYETKKNPYSKKKTATLNKKNKQQNVAKSSPQAKFVLYTVIGFMILFAISYRNSLINETFTKKEKLKNDLAVIQKENEQLEVNIQNSLNLNNVEKSAKELLGMRKLDNLQKRYVNLPKQDYIEPAGEEIVINQNENWFEKIVNGLLKSI